MRTRMVGTVAVACAVAGLFMAAQAEDLKIAKKTSVGATSFSAETYVKGARERNVLSIPGAPSNVTIRQCDLKRTLTLSEQNQVYLVTPDPESDDVNEAAALLTGAPAAPQSGGKILVTSTITDTGERKTMFGYQARHLKTTVVSESSAGACSSVHQKSEIDGWYADIGKELSAACGRTAPPIRQGETCHDRVVLHSKGTAKTGFPLVETITITNADAQPITMSTKVESLSRQALPADLFDVPAGYRQVNSMAELYGMPQMPATPTQAAMTQPAQPMPGNAGPGAPAAYPAGAANPYAGMNAAAYAQQAAMANRGMAGMPGIPGAAPAGGAPVATPQALGPKAPGKIRIGVVAPEAQLGQGSTSGMDYGTPIRNAIIAYMNGPAVEIAALDSRIPMQVQAEAQQKQCDYILYSTVNVKHGGGGGFGKWMKMAGPATAVAPMAGGMNSMGAAAAASMATSTMAQTAAMNSLAGFNGQIKSKDEVSMAYQFVPTGQQTPKLNSTLKAKATADGEDVMSPLIQQMATTVLTEAAKK